MSERYLFMSGIAEALCRTCIRFEVETHCFGGAFTKKKYLGIRADRNLMYEHFLENPDSLFFSSS